MLIFSSPNLKSVELLRSFPTVDYSEKLKRAKAIAGASLMCHPEYDPLKHLHHFEPWRQKLIQEAHNANH